MRSHCADICFEIGYASNMSVGEYEIPYGLTNEEIAAILKAGPLE